MHWTKAVSLLWIRFLKKEKKKFSRLIYLLYNNLIILYMYHKALTQLRQFFEFPLHLRLAT